MSNLILPHGYHSSGSDDTKKFTGRKNELVKVKSVRASGDKIIITYDEGTDETADQISRHEAIGRLVALAAMYEVNQAEMTTEDAQRLEKLMIMLRDAITQSRREDKNDYSEFKGTAFESVIDA